MQEQEQQTAWRQLRSPVTGNIIDCAALYHFLLAVISAELVGFPRSFQSSWKKYEILRLRGFFPLAEDVSECADCRTIKTLRENAEKM